MSIESETKSGWLVPFLAIVAICVVGLGFYLRGAGEFGVFPAAPGMAANVYDGPDGEVVLVESTADGTLQHRQMTYYKALESDKILLVDFWASWCGPCKMLAPELEAVIRNAPARFAIVKIDVDATPQISNYYKVEGIPHVFIHRDKTVIGQFGGYMPQKSIESGLEHVLAGQ